MTIDYAKIGEILEENGVMLAYVFGSYAEDKAGPSSDFDIAVVFSDEASGNEYKSKELKIAHEIGKILEISKVDVVNLKTSRSPLLKHRAVFFGIPIFVKGKKAQADLERRVRQEYEDTKYLRTKMYDIMGRQIKEGSLGKALLSPAQEKSFAKYAHR